MNFELWRNITGIFANLFTCGSIIKKNCKTTPKTQRSLLPVNRQKRPLLPQVIKAD